MISVDNGLQRKCQKNSVRNGEGAGAFPPKIVVFLIID